MEWLIENPKDGTLLILIPWGEHKYDWRGDRVDYPTFYLAMHPVTNAQYKQFINDTGYRAPDECDEHGQSPVWQGRDYPPEKANHPIVCVSWEDARAYCHWAGLRLPLDEEWAKAAGESNGLEYPWGKTWDQNKCRNSQNSDREHTCSIWEHGAGCSPWGIYQMVGNVWEWCTTTFDEEKYIFSKTWNMPEQKAYGNRRIRGRSWRRDNGTRCLWEHSVSSRYDDVGFRCARNL
jgi:formylglycine-generating enzyme